MSVRDGGRGVRRHKARSDSSSVLLTRPAPLAVRRIALHHLADAASAERRLRDKKDDEALHDFRVALRRLRSTLKAYRPYVKDSVPKKLVRRLGDLQDRTNAPRDWQVQLQWLENVKGQLRPTERPGCDQLIKKIRKSRPSVHKKDLGGRFRGLKKKLDKDVRSYSLQGKVKRSDPAPLMSQAASRTLDEALGMLAERLSVVRDADQVAEVHRARIVGKKVRYLAESFKKIGNGREVVARLKRLQDVLGELHDVHVLESWLKSLKRKDSDTQSTIDVLAEQLRMKKRTLFETAKKEFLGGNTSRLTTPLKAFVTVLRTESPC